jgi:hypothetical protein
VNYLLGNDPSKWLRGLRTFGEVRYQSLYPGVDARFYGHQGRLEYDFIVAPGADPGWIGLALRGADDVHLAARGRLRVSLSNRTLIQPPPRIYQTIAGHRQPVPGGYVLTGRDRFSFRLGAYDKRRPLVIDPVLAYSTYLGGSDSDEAIGIAADASGGAYVTGVTVSPDLPTSAGASDSGLSGNGDVFVSKLDPSGSRLVYSTYLGGSVHEWGIGIAVDPLGAAYVTGFTGSADFPSLRALSSPPSVAGGKGDAGDDAFVAKLDASGNSLVYSTYLGESSDDRARGSVRQSPSIPAGART